MRSTRLLALVTALGAAAAGVAVALGAPRAVGLVAAVAALVSLGATVADGRLGDRRHDADAEELARAEARAVAAERAQEDAQAKLAWRMQLTAMRRSTEADSLTDDQTGLPSEGWFVVSLESRLAAARRNLAPIAVVMLEVVEGLAEGRPAQADPDSVASALRTTLRESDGAFRLRDGGFAVLLEDSSDLGALWTIERVRQAVLAVVPDATMWAGVACYPAHGMSVDEILDQADRALDTAREWRQDRIEVASAEG